MTFSRKTLLRHAAEHAAMKRVRLMNPREKMDPLFKAMRKHNETFERMHFLKFMRLHRVGARDKAAAWKLYTEDRARWNDAGWPALLNALRGKNPKHSRRTVYTIMNWREGRRVRKYPHTFATLTAAKRTAQRIADLRGVRVTIKAVKR